MSDPGLQRQEFFVTCQWCRKEYTLFITVKDYREWQQGKHAQHAFPYLSADDRELLISRTCGKCFDEMFPEDEPDEWQDDDALEQAV